MDFDGGVADRKSYAGSPGEQLTVVGFDLDGNRTTFSPLEATQIVDAWEVVADMFSPFNVDVTTEEPPSDIPQSRILTCVIIRSTDVNGNRLPIPTGIGGYAEFNAFGQANNFLAPAFTLWESAGGGIGAGMGYVTAHEFGHNLNLYHHGLNPPFSPRNEYYSGSIIYFDQSLTWCPIMGSCYYSDIAQWSDGDYYGANNPGQDDVAILMQQLGPRPDEDANDFIDATITGASTFEAQGVIGSRSDTDLVRFTAVSTGMCEVVALPRNSTRLTSFLGSMASIKLGLRLLDAEGNVLDEDSPNDAITASVRAHVTPGTYFVEVRGTGQDEDDNVFGFSNYGSLGKYHLSGRTPLASSCATTVTCYDDGIYCNGEPQCIGGRCLANGAPPCGAGQVCNELLRTCEEAPDTDPNVKPVSCPANDRYESNDELRFSYELGSKPVSFSDAILCYGDRDAFEIVVCDGSSVNITVTGDVEPYLTAVTYFFSSLRLPRVPIEASFSNTSNSFTFDNTYNGTVLLGLFVAESVSFRPEGGIPYSVDVTVLGSTDCKQQDFLIDLPTVPPSSSSTSSTASFSSSTWTSTSTPSSSPEDTTATTKATTTTTTTSTTTTTATSTTSDVPVCERGVDNCRRCRDSECRTCGGGWYLYNGRCLPQCPPGFVGLGEESNRGRECAPEESDAVARPRRVTPETLESYMTAEQQDQWEVLSSLGRERVAKGVLARELHSAELRQLHFDERGLVMKRNVEDLPPLPTREVLSKQQQQQRPRRASDDIFDTDMSYAPSGRSISTGAACSFSSFFFSFDMINARVLTFAFRLISSLRLPLPSGLPILHSLRGATNILYLDFDGISLSADGAFGKITLEGYTLDSDALRFNAEEAIEIRHTWEIISELFSPFDVRRLPFASLARGFVGREARLPCLRRNSFAHTSSPWARPAFSD